MTTWPTETESLELVKNLFHASLASVAYLRDLFDERNFIDSETAGVRTKSLRPTDACATALGEWLTQEVFSALEKKSLHRISFGLYRDAEGLQLIELYECTMVYDACPLVVPDSVAIAQKSKQLMRTLVQLTEAMAALPVERHLLTNVSYITSSNNNNINYYNCESGRLPGCGYMELGAVTTAYHKFSVRVVVRDLETSNSHVYRNGVKPTLSPLVRNLRLDCSVDESTLLRPTTIATPLCDLYKHAKYEKQPASTDRPLDEAPTEAVMAVVVPVKDAVVQQQEDNVSEERQQEDNMREERQQETLVTDTPTEEDIREASKVILANAGKTERLSGLELLRILSADTDKFGEAPRLGALVKRSPLASITEKMMKGVRGASRAVFLYPSLERLAAMGCLTLRSTDNGKQDAYDATSVLYDAQGNLKSDTVIVVTARAHQLLATPKRGRGRPLGSFKTKKESKRKRAQLTDALASPGEDEQGDFKRHQNSGREKRQCGQKACK